MGNCYPSTPMKNKDSPLSQFSMNIICTVWNKESHGLHDYESKNSNKQTFRVQFTGGLMKNKKVFNYCREDTLEKKNIEEQNNKLLFQIQNTNSDYFLNSQSFNIKSSERLGLEQYSIWQVIKGVKEASQLTLGYKLSIGDFIKLGRVRFRVKNFKGMSIENLHGRECKEDIITQGDPLEEFVASHKRKESLSLINANDSKKERILSQTNLNLSCRICLEKNESEDNPLLTPCKCSGTMKFIHLECLQKWLRGKTIIKQNAISTTIIYKSLSCELCKTTFPEFLTGTDGKKYLTLDYKMPSNNYIVLEILNKDDNTPKGLHIVDMKTKQNIKIGRAHDSDLRFSDISVSRTHAIIHFNNGDFYIEDNNSKFGTLILLRKPINLKNINPKNFSIQIESTNISFQNILFTKSKRCLGFKLSNKENEASEVQKTNELITLPERINHQTQHQQINPNPHESGEMNSHDLAAQLDSHLNNSILINDEVLDHENNHNNIINNNVIPMGIFPNELHILNINALNQPDSINNLPNHPAQQNYHIIQNAENNPVFNFDSDDNNDEEINNYSFEFREGSHNLPIRNEI